MPTTIQLTHHNTVSRVRFQSENGIPLLGESARAELSAALGELEARPECRVVVFEAEGRTFIAGADINELQQLDAESARQLATETHALFDRIEALPAVTLASVHAACAGGGFELALACDLRFAAESAKLGLPEVTLGLIPGWGGTMRMTRLFGPAVARHVILRGELLSASEALKLGLVTRVSPDDAFRKDVDAQIELLASRSPSAIRAAKALLRSQHIATFEDEAQAFGDCFDSPDAAEGIAAFLEKRQAAWK